MNCPSCGAANSDQAKFCLECGNPLAVTPANCPSCQAPLAEGAKFCTACGTAIAPATATASTPAEPAKAEAAKPAAADEKPWTWEVTSSWGPIPHRQAARQLTIVAVIACVLVAIVAAIHPLSGEGGQPAWTWLPPLVFLGCAIGLWFRQWIAGVVALLFWAWALIASLPGLATAFEDSSKLNAGVIIGVILSWVIVPAVLWGGIRGARAWQRFETQPTAKP